VLGFPPGTKITITNLSSNITHTLDFVAKRKAPPARFPASPKLSIPAQGDGKLEKGYASGPISPGKTVTVTLVRGSLRPTSAKQPSGSEAKTLGPLRRI
jgi:hypothetical protein